MSKKPNPGAPRGNENRGEQVASDLAATAEALAAELRKYEALSAELMRIPLNSEKNLSRAMRVVREAADSQEQVGVRVGALVAAVSAARERQQASAEGLLARAQEVQRRAQQLEALLDRFEALGKDARDVNAMMQDMTKLSGQPGSAGANEAIEQINAIDERIGATVDAAKSLATDAAEQDMPDIAQRSDAVRQQMAAVRNRLRLLQKSLMPQA